MTAANVMNTANVQIGMEVQEIARGGTTLRK